MSKFVSLKVSNIIRETPDANTIVFEKPAGDGFDYKPGQYLTLKVDVNGESLRRAYSLCSSPITDAELAVTVKRVEGGRMSNHLPDHLKVGDTVEVMPPMGNFFVDLEPNKSHHYVLLGGGSGITPLMSILKSVLQVESQSKVTLIYGNRDEASIIFRDQLNDLQTQYGDRLRQVHSLDQAGPAWTGLTGQLSRHNLMPILQDLFNADNLNKTFHLCGPSAMMEEAQAALAFMGVGSKEILKESFTAPLPSADDKPKTVVQGARGTYTITVLLDGDEKEVEVKENTTILEAVIDDGMDPPYACQMGVCCTCRAKVLSGQVEMEEDEGLSDAEIAEGYVLTCQSHPLTPDVKLEYM